jgi:hypothetical protein
VKWKFAAAFVAVVIAVSMLITSAPPALADHGPIEPVLPDYPTQYPTVEVNDRFLEKEPWVEVNADGTATIHWELKAGSETSGGTVYYGVYHPDQELDYPRFRKYVRFGATDEGATISIKTFFKDKYDTAHFADRCEGVIAYRIEIFDMNPGKDHPVRNYDGRFNFKCEEEDGNFVNFAKTVSITEGPFVDQITEHSVIISWETDGDSTGKVIVGGGEYTDGVTAERHEVAIDGLSADRTYNYKVKSSADGDTVSSREYYFTTCPENAEVLKFGYLSDSREGEGGGLESYKGVNYGALRDLFGGMYNQDVDFIVFAGDLVNGYTTDVRDFEMQLEAWKRAVEPIGHYIPIYEGMGNHEALMTVYNDGTPYGAEFDKYDLVHGWDYSAEAIFANEFVNPLNGPASEAEGLPPYTENVYSFDYGNTHIIVFNTNYFWANQPEKYGGNLEGYVMDEQIEWIEDDLADARARGIKHIFMFAHEPTFPNGGHLKDAQWYNGDPYVVAQRDKLWEIISYYDVLAVGFGDEHNYQRVLIDKDTPVHPDGTTNPEFVNPVWQIVNGCAGAPFYAQQEAPWTNNVKKFTSQIAYTIFSVEGSRVYVETYSRDGQIIDECELTSIKTAEGRTPSVEELADELDDLENQQGELASSLTALSDAMTTLANTMDALADATGELEDEVDDLQGRSGWVWPAFGVGIAGLVVGGVGVVMVLRRR